MWVRNLHITCSKILCAKCVIILTECILIITKLTCGTNENGDFC